MIEFIRELFTANYVDGKIHNCKKHSFVWEHEFRHSEQEKIPFLRWCGTWLPYLTSIPSIPVLFMSISEPILLWYIGLFFIPFLLFIIYIEIEAWFYAVLRYKKMEK